MKTAIHRLTCVIALFPLLVSSCSTPGAQKAAPPTVVVEEALVQEPTKTPSLEPTPSPQPSPAPEIGDEEEAALVYVSEMYDIPMDRLIAVAETEANYLITGVQLSGLKIQDEETGEVYGAYVDKDLNIVDIREIERDEQAAYFETYGKLEPALYERLQEVPPDAKLTVGIWLTPTEGPVERPNQDISEEEFEAFYKELLDAKEGEYEQLRQPVMDFLGGGKEGTTIVYLSKYAPLLFASVPAEMIEGLQKIPEVNQIFLSKKYEPEEDSAAVTERADEVWAEGITGNRVKIAVVEGDAIEFMNPHLKYGAYFSSSYLEPLDSYAGPDTSDDGIELTDFAVSGSPNVGAPLVITYRYENTTAADMAFDPYGIFVACRDPDGNNRDFGHWVFSDGPLHPGQGARHITAMVLDKPGTWTFWPAYYYDGHWGPYQWNTISVDVVENDTPVTLGSYPGSATSGEGILVTDFSVSGSPWTAVPRVGAFLTVQYTYQNTNDYAMTFDPPGIFVSCEDPDGDNRDFGHTHPITLNAGDSVTLSADVLVDEVGTWSFRPAYKYAGNWDSGFLQSAVQVDVEDRPAATEIGDHATAVAGIIASTHDTYKGIAYGAPPLLSADAPSWDDSSLIAATEWALEHGARVFNNSWGLDTDLQMDARDRYMDHLVSHYFVTVVNAAGNSGRGDGDVTSPGLAYNVITVGAIDDSDDGNLNNDTMANFSSYNDPHSPHGDREKPEVVAVGMRINTMATSAPWTGGQWQGTSFAAPQVVGEAALLMERANWLRLCPETLKAVIMASAVHNITGTTRLSDEDGAGGIDCAQADEIVSNSQMIEFDLEENEFPRSYEFDVTEGQKVRVVIAWSSHPELGLPPDTDPLEADLDLHIYDPSDVRVAYSCSWDNSYEIVEFEAGSTGTYTAEIRSWRFDGSQEYVGLAYSLD